MNDYCKLNFLLAPVDPVRDILIQELADAGFESFVETEGGCEAFIPAQVFSDENVQEIVAGLAHLAEISFNRETIGGKNWNAVWEESFSLVHEPGRFTIYASFHEIPSNPGMLIQIEPRMAFGTGHHPTTRLMARHLMDLDCMGKSVLDMGCGTGILSVIAEKSGASEVLAVDNEAPAVENTLSNLTLNQCVKVSVEKGSAECLKNRHFHVILANINRNVLWEHIPVYAEVLVTGGQLWLSGFFKSDVPRLMDRLNACGFMVIHEDVLEEWCLLKCRKQ